MIEFLAPIQKNKYLPTMRGLGGFGIGKSIINKNNNLEAFVFMKLQDSHNKSQYLLAHTFQKRFYTAGKANSKAFIGYIAGFSFRNDMYNYSPIPMVFPVFGATYKNFSLEGSYLPFYNVLFMWIKYRFN